ncbi:ATPase AAA [Clostridia bacterium]|nr:ATPase AAA [Clostridia bacterium]
MFNEKCVPHLFVFAGANGSGKSTVIDFYLQNNLCPKDYICPDQLVPADKKDDVGEYIRAMEEAERRRKNNVTMKSSFTFETVLSTRSKLDFIKYAKSEGYLVTVIYVITSDSNINIERVAQRVLHGGHDVPKDKIISRYKKSMKLMFEVIRTAHEALIYDNSGEKPVVVFAKHREEDYHIVRPFPDWIKQYCDDATI